MTWEVTSITLDGDKVTQKVGSLSLEWPNAHNDETYKHPSLRFPIKKGTAAQQIAALKLRAETAKDRWIARREACDSLSGVVLSALNA